MIKVLFAILVFFFFVSVLFFGIRFVLTSISSMFYKEKAHHINTGTAEFKTIKVAPTASHQLSYYDPVINEHIQESGDIIKCYIEHGVLWVKFKPLGFDSLKIIKVEHITNVKNLKTAEDKNNTTEVTSYFDRFL